jgi:dihydropteroate synthase
MGILNVTPDSFSDGGRFYALESAIRHGVAMVEDGADIIDIGGESTRPGAKAVSLKEELRRVIPVIKEIARAKPRTVLSIDTYKSAVAEAAVRAGARIINDISGLGFDRRIAGVARKYRTPLILMHIKGTPRNMQDNPVYADVISEIIRYFRKRIDLALAGGVNINQIIIDPGIGFGKRLEDNYGILRRLGELKALGRPIMLGTSRKSFIGRVLNLPPEQRVIGTAATCAVGIINGADIIRVHDVVEMKQVALICAQVMKDGN